jgi:hypothetical protein
VITFPADDSLRVGPTDQLTPEQVDFAARRNAEPGRVSPVFGRFFYSESDGQMRRWLVAPDGRVLESTTFAVQAARV